MNKGVYRDQFVKVSEHSNVNFLNVHASKDHFDLKIFGSTFHDVRGMSGYYLTLPNTNLLLFVTGEPYGGQAVVHIANTNTHVIKSFPAYDSTIGTDITGSKVEGLNGGDLVIRGSGLSPVRRYYIDLNAPAFVKEQFDTVHDGKRVRFVLPQGKLSLQENKVLETP